ncbi:MAG TPA: DNA methyltransferase [Trueperaceae bacterium]
MPKTLYYGDNLDILRESISDESVDLIYLDPPFNSAADYNVIFREHLEQGPQAQITAFEDTWQWSESSARALDELVNVHGALAEFMDFTVRRLGHNALSAYLAMMAIRLVELHRVLKPTGSLFLHCDPTASHYLKVVLDILFVPTNFRSEIIWRRHGAHNDASRNLASVHDVILYYAKRPAATFNRLYTAHDPEYIERAYRHFDDRGRYRVQNLASPNPRPNLTYDYTALNGLTYKPHPNGWKYTPERLRNLDEEGRLHYPNKPDGRLALKNYLGEMTGPALSNLWTDIGGLSGSHAERLGYPTQKPVALLERIVEMASNPGDIVLDPFCGCGTAISAAEKFGRQWVGIDVTHLAVSLIQARLRQDFGLESGEDYALEGTPSDVESARYLFEQKEDGPYQFQFWAVGLIGAQPFGAGASGKKGKKGRDSGIDGVLYFRTPGGEKLEKVIVSVKGGKSLNPGMIRDLESVVRREKAAMGVFLTLEEPTQGMRQEAAKHGLYHHEDESYPVMQILTVADLLNGKRPAIPRGAANVSLDRKEVKTIKSDKRSKSMNPLFGKPVSESD